MTYCKECGKEYESEKATVCLNCGVKKGNGSAFCDGCGTEKKSEKQDICLTCGKDFKKFFKSIPTTSGESDKTKLVALLLSLFVGGFGGHLFYVGRTGRAILYICLTLGTVITCGITAIPLFIFQVLDIVNICTDKFVDANGNVLTVWS